MWTQQLAIHGGRGTGEAKVQGEWGEGSHNNETKRKLRQIEKGRGGGRD